MQQDATVLARTEWLREHSQLNMLSSDFIEAIASRLVVYSLAENRRLVLEDTDPEALYILKSGRLESYRTRRISVAQATVLEPGAVIHLEALLLNSQTTHTVISLADSELWKLEKACFQQIMDDFPGLRQELLQRLTDTLEDLTEQLAYEQEKQQALRPYLVTRVKRGVVGSSRYAARLRQSIREVTHGEAQSKTPSELSNEGSAQPLRRQPILIFGEPGLN